jgi:hypothetical protein
MCLKPLEIQLNRKSKIQITRWLAKAILRTNGSFLFSKTITPPTFEIMILASLRLLGDLQQQGIKLAQKFGTSNIDVVIFLLSELQYH